MGRITSCLLLLTAQKYGVLRKNIIITSARKFDKFGDWYLVKNRKLTKAIFTGRDREVFYYYRFDAHCCPGCGIWLNEKCSDPGCVYCSRRLDSPLEALFYERYRSGGKDWRRDNWLHKESGRRRKKRRSEIIQ